MSSEAASGWRTRQRREEAGTVLSRLHRRAPPASALPAVFLQRAAAPVSSLTSSDSPRKPSVVCVSVRILSRAGTDGAASSTSPELLSMHAYDVARPLHACDVAPPSPVARSSRLLEDRFFLHVSQRTAVSLASPWMPRKRFSKPWQPRDVHHSHLLRKRQPLQVPSRPPPCSVAMARWSCLLCRVSRGEFGPGLPLTPPGPPRRLKRASLLSWSCAGPGLRSPSPLEPHAPDSPAIWPDSHVGPPSVLPVSGSPHPRAGLSTLHARTPLRSCPRVYRLPDLSDGRLAQKPP